MQQTFKTTLTASLACLAMAAAPGAASAAAALQGLGIGGSSFANFDQVDTVGWKFTTNSALSVTKLGWFVQAPSLNNFHEVGIWNAAGVLLGSGTVLPGPASGDGFRYVSTLAKPFTLTKNTDYFIGGVDLLNDGDNYITGISYVITDPAITFRGAARAPTSTGLVFPSLVTAVNGRFGPTFQFAVIPEPTAGVPEPASWVMMIAGFGLAGAAMRRRRRAWA